MHFQEIKVLMLLWSIPLLALLYVYSFRKRESLLRVFCREEASLKRLLPAGLKKRRITKALLVISAFIFLILALARPQWGFQWVKVTRKGVDIVIALDVSRSMTARDVDPSRLERAVREVTDLLGMLQGDRIALVAFAGSSFIECPLTLDYQAFRLFLNAVGPDLIPVPGTAIGSAITTALSAFDRKADTSRAVILITDGENLRGHPLKAAQRARKAGVKIFTIGVGSREGAPIPRSGTGGGFKKDSDGNLVLTRLDEKTLEQIALTTGGSYVRSVTGDMDLKTIYQKGIRKEMKLTELGEKRRKKWKERFQWPLFAAVLSLVMEAMVQEKGEEKIR